MVNRGLSSPALDSVFWVLTSLGLGWVQVLLHLPLFVFPQLRPAALASLAAFLLAAVSLHFGKWQFPRLRPTNLPETLGAADERIFLSSFPSGHTTTSFAIATALTILWPGRRLLVGFALIPIAMLVGVSRVYRGVHWPTDVIGGALLGFACGAIAAYFFSSRDKS